MNAIHLSETFSIPAEALTQTFAIPAKRGAGKSYTALVLAEEMFPLGQIVVIDPVGACWGLRSWPKRRAIKTGGKLDTAVN